MHLIRKLFYRQSITVGEIGSNSIVNLVTVKLVGIGVFPLTYNQLVGIIELVSTSGVE